MRMYKKVSFPGDRNIGTKTRHFSGEKKGIYVNLHLPGGLFLLHT